MLLFLIDRLENLLWISLNICFRKLWKGWENNIHKEGDEIVSWYEILLLVHNASGFDSWVVLNSLDKKMKDLNVKRTARGMISISFRCGFKTVNSVEVPRYGKFTCTRSHIFDFLDQRGREYGLQPKLLKELINHSEIKQYNYNELRLIWEQCLKSDILCLAFVYPRHAVEMQKMTNTGVKEASLGENGFGLYNKNREIYTLNNKYVRDFTRKSIKGGRVCAFNRYFESKQFDELMLTIEKHLKINGNEISIVIDKYLDYKTKKRENIKRCLREKKTFIVK